MEWVRLGDVASKITKGTTPTSVGFNFVDKGINFVKAESISENGQFIGNKFDHISDKCNEKLARSQLQENDILFSIAGVIGRTAIVKKEILPANTNQALAIIRIPSGVFDYSFLMYALKSPLIVEQYEKQKQGVAQINLSLQNVSNFRIPKLCLEDQRYIAAVLDKVTGLIAQRRTQLDKLDLLIKSRFVEMFGDPVLNPNGYNIQSLQSLLDDKIITYHLDGNHGGDYPRSEEFVDSGVPYIGANCIKNGIIDFSLAKYLTQERASKLRKGIAQNGDVLFAHNATVGPVVVLETKEPKIILSTSLTAYRCNRKVILPNYLKAYMLSDGFIRQYSEEMKQTTRNQVPITAQRKYLFMVPPISQQKEFDSFVAYTDKAKAKIQISLDKMEILKKSLMQKYFE